MEKGAFRELKNIQIVLLSAMVRVDKNYTLYQFENEIKSVLTKCANTLKKENKSDDKTTADENESVTTNNEHRKEGSSNENKIVVDVNNNVVSDAANSECKKETSLNEISVDE